jgi:hypothetical protein
MDATANAFSEGRALPHLQVPEDPAVKQKFAAQINYYSILSAKLFYIQGGRDPADSPQTFRAMIRHVAGELRLDKNAAIALYGQRVRIPGQPDARLGESAARAVIMAGMLSSKKLSPEMHKRILAKFEKTRRELLKTLRDDGSVTTSADGTQASRKRETVDFRNLPPEVQPLLFKVLEPPMTAPSKVLKAENIFAYMDLDKAKTLAQEVWKRARGFKQYCYRAVKAALDYILPAGWRGKVGGTSAYQFAKSINRNPKLLDALNLRKIDPNTLPDGIPPVGSIIVYGRGVCGASRQHGHIEVMVTTHPPLAVSDGWRYLTSDRLACVRKNSRKNLVNVYVPVRSSAE